MNIKIYEITGKYAISADMGQLIYDQIHTELLNGHSVTLDFADVDVFVSAFFNLAIGQLLKDIAPNTLNQLLKIEHLTSTGQGLLKTIIDNAKQYYSDPEHQQAVDGAIETYALSLEA
ncbi:MAG: STAS-like domain-containing protein [Cyanobacteria bacterium J06621_3]